MSIRAGARNGRRPGAGPAPARTALGEGAAGASGRCTIGDHDIGGMTLGLAVT